MYQFYYSDDSKIKGQPEYKRNVKTEYDITAIRPTMWEEHCLECSAPACFDNCTHYLARCDGRCKRFENGMFVYENDKGCCGQGMRVKFRKWANMMTIIFPAMLETGTYADMTLKNQRLGKKLKKTADSKLPVKIKWDIIRTKEFLRRKKLRGLEGLDNTPDAFIFHGYSFEKSGFNLIVEIYDHHTPVFKTALKISHGENLYIFDDEQLNKACSVSGYLVKIYPENDIEAELDVLWCDFVKGGRIISEKPAGKVKCVVWDLDNTIWNGTLIEAEYPEKFQLNDSILETIQSLDERGIIQSVASKNDYENAWRVVEALGIADYFLYPQIHWNAKSGSLKQIAKSLNIGVDSLVLIDDSQFERNQVMSALPQVRTYDVTDIPSLLNEPEFDVIVTEESKKRRAMYKAEEKRNHLLQSDDNGDTVSFLKKCHLSIAIFEPQTEEEKVRCFELVVRTNQLNMSGKKYSRNEFEEMLKRENHSNFAFSCKDDFGSYGIVGFGQYRVEKGKIIFTEFAMSCRVAGKYVESALFSNLLRKENCYQGEFTVNKTKKNVLLRNTLQQIGFEIINEADTLISYQYTDGLINQEIVNTNER